MKKSITILVLILLLGLTNAMATSTWSGSGTSSDPYQISTAAELALLATNVNAATPVTYEGVYFKLMNDIDLTIYLASGGAGYNGGSFWLPIGGSKDINSDPKQFKGYFDGNSKIVSGLKIIRSGNAYIGLFGCIGATATIINIGVQIDAASSITGDVAVGGVVGFNYGIVFNCFSTGTINGFSAVGGVVGLNYSSVKYCYSTATVSADSETGGLVGTNQGAVNNSFSTGTTSSSHNITGYTGGLVGRNVQGAISYCYATGAVGSASINIGGLTGENYQGTITNSYWDKTTTGQTTSPGSLASSGKTTAEMKTQSTFSGWDFASTWGITNSYPFLLPAGPTPNAATNITSGSFTANWQATAAATAYYLDVSTNVGFTSFVNGYNNKNTGNVTSYNVGGLSGNTTYYYRVRYSNTVATSANSAGISVTTLNFSGGTGTIGDPYQITTAEDLNIVRNNLASTKYFKLMNDIDLTTYLASDGAGYNSGSFWTPIGASSASPFSGKFNGNSKKISGLKINRSGSNIGLFGYIGSAATLTNIGVEIDPASSVNGSTAAGLVGYNNGSVSNCYVKGAVIGSGSGGVTGCNKGTVSNCYFIGTVSGTMEVGGIAGDNLTPGVVNYCYATGGLIAPQGDIGGLVGYNTGTVNYSYWDKNTTGQTISAGSLASFGKTTAEMKTQSTFSGWDFVTTPIWHISTTENNGYPHLSWQVFPIPAPTITSFTPATGPVGTLVTITGTNLSSPTAFTIGGVTAIVVSNTGSTLVGMVMPGATTGTVSITTAGGTATSTSNFTVTPTLYPGVQQGSKMVGTGNTGAAIQGCSVAISADGSTAIWGGYGDNTNQGAAWIFIRTAGTWTQQAMLIGTGNTLAAKQGKSVAISADGNTVIVGGPYNNSTDGAAWVYTRSGTTWAQQTMLYGTGKVGTSPSQGTSVALSADGNTALVGGPMDNSGIGAVWVFTRLGIAWTQQAKLTATTIGAAQLGYSVSLSADGNTALMGGNYDNSGIGAVWVFTRSGGAWTQQTELIGTGNTGAAQQGKTVSLSADGNTAIVGGFNNNSGKGASWIFTRSGTSWTQQSMLIGTGNSGTAYQGCSVALSADGNTAMTGGFNNFFGQGGVWVYTRSGSSWTQKTILSGTLGTSDAAQGYSVALSADGNTAIEGGYTDNTGIGATWVFTPCTSPAISSQSTTTQTQNLGGTFTAISVTATGNGLSYQWYKKSTADTTGGIALGTNSNSYTPLADTAGTRYYYCKVTGTCGIATSVISGAFITNLYPTAQASNVSFASVAFTQMAISWTNGTGNKRAVFIKQANTGTATPVNNTTYTANTVFSSGTQIPASGWYCIYNGTGTGVTVTGLTYSTNYIVQPFEYNGSAGSEKYLTAIATNNPNTTTTLTAYFTDGTNYYSDWSSAMTGSGGSTITMLANYTATSGSTITSNVSLNTSTYTFGGNQAFTIASGKTFSLKGTGTFDNPINFSSTTSTLGLIGSISSTFFGPNFTTSGSTNSSTLTIGDGTSTSSFSLQNGATSFSKISTVNVKYSSSVNLSSGTGTAYRFNIYDGAYVNLATTASYANIFTSTTNTSASTANLQIGDNVNAYSITLTGDLSNYFGGVTIINGSTLTLSPSVGSTPASKFTVGNSSATSIQSLKTNDDNGAITINNNDGTNATNTIVMDKYGVLDLSSLSNDITISHGNIVLNNATSTYNPIIKFGTKKLVFNHGGITGTGVSVSNLDVSVVPLNTIFAQTTTEPLCTGIVDATKMVIKQNMGTYWTLTLVPPPVQVLATAGTAGPTPYTTLKDAFDAINLGTHQGAITIRVNGSTSETSSAVLNASDGSSSYTSVNIYPTTAGLSISGNVTYSPLIDLNGADSVTIDGRVNAAGSTVSLVISNASTSSWYSTSTIRFTNDATYNIIKYCKLQGSTTAGDHGILSFYRVAIASGNSYNTIDHNEITNAGGNRPRNALFSFGKSELVPNSSNIVSNNNIYDVLNLSQNYTKAIALYTSEDAHPNNSYNTGWTISGNSFYDTQDLPTTNLDGDAKVIFVWASQGSGFTISNNYIGGNAPLCSGTWTKTNGNIAFVAIFLNVNENGTANYIQGNTIKNFNYANSGNYGWNGIYFNSGANNVTDNCIGASIGTGSIIFTTGASDGGFTGISQGVYCSSTCSNNTIGSITVANSNQAYATNFTGIWVSSYCGSGTTSNNKIGSTTTPNSINTTSASSSNAQTLVGIKIQGGATHNIADNTVANLTNGTTNASPSTQGYIYGIYAFQGINTITGNTVHDLTIANADTARGPINTSGNPTLSLSAGGIVAPIYSNSTQAISGNTIYNISNTNSSFAGTIAGLYYFGKESSNPNTIAQNFIHNLSVTGDSSIAANIYGIKIASGSSTYANNIISLGGNTATTLYGIYVNDMGVNDHNTNLFFNTVYLSGITSGSQPSYALYSSFGAVSTSTRNFRNNIFYNARRIGSTKAPGNVAGGTHYAAYFAATSGPLTCDYNDYYVSTASGSGGMLGHFGLDDKPGTPIVTGLTGNDEHSKKVNPGFAPGDGTVAANYLPSNLTLLAATGTGITTDYGDTVTRSIIGPSIGAWEYAVTPPPVIVTATGGTTGPTGYNTLREAFDAINLGTHQAVITVKINASTTETASAVLRESGYATVTPPGLSSYSSVNVYPTTTGLSVSGNLAAPLIDLNGADSVTIDGRVNATGSAKDLVITNISTTSTDGTSTIRFINDASTNKVKYCTIKGSSTTNSAETADKGAIVFFSTGTVTGNDGNTIEYNNFTNAGSRPRYTIYSEGTNTQENSVDTIRNNNFYDFFSLQFNSFGIELYLNNTAWTLSDNSFYEMVSLIPAQDAEYYMIDILNSGVGYTVSNNHIGGSSALCGGNAFTKTNAYNNAFYGIQLNVGTATASNVQGNIIKNFSWFNRGRQSIYGIRVNGGSVNIGTSSGNQIGEATGTSSITMTNGDFAGIFYGLYLNGTGLISASNNTIGSITVANTVAANATSFYGIYKSNVNATLSLSNNTVTGINASSSSTSVGQMVYGIYLQGAGTNTINGNTVADLTNASTFSWAQIIGIYTSRGANTVTNNNIHHLTIANANTSSNNMMSVAGIYVAGSDAAQTVSGNTVHDLSNSHSSFAGHLAGLYLALPITAVNTIAKNFIYNLSVSGASSIAANIYGIKIASGLSTYANNIISLGGNTATTLYGIYETGVAGNNNNLYFNAVYLYGSNSFNPSYALYSAVSTNSRDIRNNIFRNARIFNDTKSPLSTVTGHYAAFFAATGGTLTCDYNDYFVSTPGGILGYYVGDKTGVPIVSGVTGNDLHSMAVNPVFATPGGTTAVSYIPSEPTLAGIIGTGITTDYGDTITRSLTYPAIGAWEYAVTPPCANPTNGGTFSANQAGCSPFDPAEITGTTPTGNVGTLEYKWEASTDSISFTSLTTGTYTATTYNPDALTVSTWYRRLARVGCMTDWTGAASSDTVKMTVYPLPTANASVATHISCFGGNTGSVNVSVSGGQTAYSYAWSTNPVQTASIANTLTSGIYSVTVTDVNGCKATSSALVTQPNAALTANSGVITHVNCYGNNNGSVNVSVSGGTTNYSYAWSTNPAQTAALATGLTTGTYTVTVTDGNACTATSSAIVTQPNAPLTATAGVITQVNCYGNNNGSVNVSVSGGTANYSYAWSTNPLQTAAQANGLTIGTYWVTVSDANGCKATSSATINQPDALTATASLVANVSIYEGSDGSITVSSSGGTTPYSYKWSSTPQQTTQTATGLSAGTYWVTVTDSHTCTATSSVVVTQPTPPTFQATYVLVTAVGSRQAAINWTKGDGDGRAVFVKQGSTGIALPENNVSYPADTVFGTDGSQLGTSGWYCVYDGIGTHVTVTGLNPSTDYQVHICEYKLGSKTYNTGSLATNPANYTTYSTLLAAITVVENVSCNGLSDGSATVSASGGNPSYSYLWSSIPAQTAQTATGLSAGTYTVTVTDGVSATVTSSIAITQPDVLTASASVSKTITCHQGMDGSITANVGGGTLAYNYSWSTVPVQNAATATGLSAGDYSVTVTDANGCTATASATTTQPVQWWPELTGQTPVCQNTSGNIYTTDLGMTDYTWAVSSGGIITSGGTSADNTVTISWITAGPQTVSVNYKTPAGCFAVEPKVKNVYVNVAPTPILTGAANVTQGQVITYQTAYTPGNGYTWNASHGNPEICFPNHNCLTLTWDFPCGVIAKGYVTVTETNMTTGCSTTATMLISITP